MVSVKSSLIPAELFTTGTPKSLIAVTTTDTLTTPAKLTLANDDNQTIEYFYDARNRLKEIQNIDGSRTKYEYDALNNLTKVIDAGNYESVYSYETVYSYESLANDSRLRRKETKQQIKDGRYLVTQTKYNNALQVTEVTKVNEAKDKKTKYEYDDLGRQVHVEQELDTPLENGANKIDNYTTYYDNGSIKTIKDGDDHTTTYTYNPRNLKATSTDALGTITSYGYDDANNLTSMSTSNLNIAGTASISYGYDALNRRNKVTDALNGVMQTTYDLSGNITQTEDALHRKTNYGYDASNRQLTVTTDGLPDKTIIKYDELGRVKSQTMKGLSSVDERVTTYAYDDAHNITTVAKLRRVGKLLSIDIADIKVKVDGILVDSFKYNSSHNGGNFTFISSFVGWANFCRSILTQ